MRGFNHQLVVTTTTDEATGTEVPLFAFPVQVCKATGTDEVKFDRAAPSGGTYSTVYRDDVTGEEFDREEFLRGVRTGDSFQAIDAEAIKAIDDSIKSDRITVERTVELADVPFDRVCGRSFLRVPAKNGHATAYRGLYEALLPLAKKGKQAARPARALRVKYVGRTRERMGVIYADPQLGCLMLIDLEFAAVCREPDEQVQSHLQAEVPEAMVGQISSVLDGLDQEEAGDWSDPVDQTIALRAELVEKALVGEAIVAPAAEAKTVAVDDLSAVLAKSLDAVAA